MNNSDEIIKIKKEVFEANKLLKEFNLVIHTWGNVSGITKDRQFMVIKPSGVSYNELTWEDMVVIDMNSSKTINSNLNPSSDSPTHILIYKHDHNIQGIVHTHSPYAVSWAQSGKDIPCFGTTHADNFYGPVPCTRELSEEEINQNYEYNTGLVIIEDFQKRNINFKSVPAVLVKEHGPFTFSYKSPKDAVNIALTLEEVAKMAINTIIINPNQKQANQYLQDKHYFRKHGKNSYYGQNTKKKMV